MSRFCLILKTHLMLSELPTLADIGRKESTMRNLMWLLPMLALTTATPAAQAQLRRSADPRFGGPFVPGIPGRGGPFAPRIPGMPGFVGAYDPLAGLPPSIRDMVAPNRGFPRARRFDPLHEFDPLAPIRVPGVGVNVGPGMPGAGFGPQVHPAGVPPSIEPARFDPKLIQNIPNLNYQSPFSLEVMQPKPPANQGVGPPPDWLRWEYAIGVVLIAAVAGVLREVFGRKLAGE